MLVGLIMGLCTPVHAQDDRWTESYQRTVQSLEAGDLPTALRRAQETLNIGRYEGREEWVASLSLQAQVLQEAGQFTPAEQALRQALTVADQIPGRRDAEKAVLHNNLAALLDLSGQLDQADQHYRSSLAILRNWSAAPAVDRLAAVANYAGLLERQDRKTEALERYREAEALLGQVDRHSAAAVASNIAVARFRAGERPEAMALLRSLIGGDEPGAPLPSLLRASLLHNLGTMALESQQHEEAGVHLEQARQLRLRLLGAQHLDLARTLHSQSLLLQAQQSTVQALEKARAATGIVVHAWQQAAGTRQAVALAQQRRDWRHALLHHIDLLTQHPSIQSSGTARPPVSEALEVLQSIKHSELAGVFANAALGLSGELGELTRELRQRAERLPSLERRWNELLQSGRQDSAAEINLRREIDTLRTDIASRQAELNRRYPKHQELVSGKVVDLSQAQAALRADEAVVLFAIGEQASYVIAFSHEQSMLARIPAGRTRVAEHVRQLRANLDPERNPQGREFAADAAHALYRLLLAPVEPVTRGKEVLYVVPDGPLESLPLSLLLLSPVQGKIIDAVPPSAWLLSRHATVTLPSLGALGTTVRETRSAPPLLAEPLVAFADPAIGRAPGAYRSMAQATLANIGFSASNASEKRLADPALIRALVALPESADEAQAIAKAVGGGRLLLRNDATETAARRTDLSPYRYVLFATHGVLASDFAEVGEPGLILTPPATATSDDDGLLTANEISRLRLDADLVVLSACNTAAGDGTPGAEGLSGLAKGFFHAGARNLLVSHWPVVSDSTVELTTGMFRHLSQGVSHDPARALRASMLELIGRHPNFAHPMYWAPFVVVGANR